jgi:bifunctional non-homologous end joining protein LigD
LEAKFPAIANAVAKLKLRSTVLDGEVVAVDENGIPRFQLLQRFQKQPTAPTLYYVFDVLWYQGDDLTQKPVLERRKVLERILKPAAGIQLGSYVEADGKALFELTIKKKIQWVWPKLVCEVEYAELTADDQLRQTAFLGWRDDKKAQEVVLEQSSNKPV